MEALAGEKNKPRLIDHMLEIRRRLMWVALVLFSGAGFAYFINEDIYRYILRPLENQQLIFTSPMGGLEFLVKLCLFFGALITIPVLVYNVLRFIEPALVKQTSRYLALVAVAATLLAAVGASFAYFITLPVALTFLTQFSTENIQPLLSTDEYLRFVMIYIVGFALLFQIPLILLFTNRLRPLSPQKLFAKTRWVTLLSFTVAAVLTPADPVTQSIMAIPMILLYEIGICLVWVANRGRPVAGAAARARPRILIDLGPVGAPFLQRRLAINLAGAAAAAETMGVRTAAAALITKFNHHQAVHPKPAVSAAHVLHRPPLHLNEKARAFISPHLLDLRNES